MFNLPEFSRKQIEEHIDKLFDLMAYWTLGTIPHGEKAKTIVFGTQPPSVTLANLFVQALRNNKPNLKEEDALKGMLRNSNNYINGIRERTKARSIAELESYISEKRKNNEQVDYKEASQVLKNEMDKSKKEMLDVVSGESQRVRGIGTALDIKKVAATQGIDDPTIFFVVMRDEHVCLEKNEKVQTSTGIKTVDDLKVGDFVICPSPPTETYHDRRKVLYKNNCVKKVIKLTFENGKEIVCSEDHPVPIFVKGKMPKSRRFIVFVRAIDLEETSEVVFQEDVKDRHVSRLLRTAELPSPFMVRLGYKTATEFWVKNLKEMINDCVGKTKKKAILEKWGMEMHTFNNRILPVVQTFFPEVGFVGGVVNNTFNFAWRKKQRDEEKQRFEKDIGGDIGLKKLIIEEGLNSVQISERFNVNVLTIRKHLKELGLTSFIRARGGRQNWEQNRDFLQEKMKNGNYLHLNTKVSRKEVELRTFLQIFLDEGIKGSFPIGKVKVDIFSPKYNLVIEYDGSGHDLHQRLGQTRKNVNEVDYCRDKELKRQGYRVFRIKDTKDKLQVEDVFEILKIFIEQKERNFYLCPVS